MYDLKNFRNQIIKYDVVIACIIIVMSLPFLKLEPFFWLGVILGTITALLSLRIMIASGKRVAENGSKGAAVAGYFLRLPIYGVVFYFCIKMNLMCGLACGLGFLTTPISIFYIYGIRSRFPGARKNPLNETDESREWNDLDDDGWDEKD
ncbi:MAG: hypothetical protein GX663_04890 [Clostridiales bacterium]|nr:hypothetical protein [Clostridiales bacterium]